jgi:hypothetical protein
VLISLIISLLQLELANTKDSESHRDAGNLNRNRGDSLLTQYFKNLPQKNKGFACTPPGINYKIKTFRPDSSIDYKIEVYHYKLNNKLLPFLKKFKGFMAIPNSSYMNFKKYQVLARH